MIAKSVTKKRQSTHKLACRLTAACYQASHTAVHKYLKFSLGCYACKPRKVPKLTNEQKKNSLQFCQEHKKWTVDDWKNVIFSDESPI